MSGEPNAPIVTVKDGTVVADSRDISAAFGKLHKNVLQKIDALVADAPELLGLNFKPMIVEVSIGRGAIRQDRAFEMDQKGFSLLAMRFTGHKALQWQIAYADEFERMRKALNAGSGDYTGLTAPDRGAIGGIVKGIVNKALTEMLPMLVKDALSSNRYHLVEGVSALEVADLAGYPAGKRPRGASQYISRRLDRYHKDRGVAVNRSRHGASKVCLFDEPTARTWLQAGGKVEIDHYIANRKGQGKLRLIAPN